MSNFKQNVKGDSRLTGGETENEAAPPKNGGASEHKAGQSLMSTVLFALSSFGARVAEFRRGVKGSPGGWWGF